MMQHLDMNSEEFPCENNICTYNTQGFTAEKSSTVNNKNNWNPPRGTTQTADSPQTTTKTWAGSPLFQ